MFVLGVKCSLGQESEQKKTNFKKPTSENFKIYTYNELNSA